MIAIIPARGGSKGLPGKNLLTINGKPLIAHAITAAKNAKRIYRVIVSTEDETIAAVSKEYGAEVPFLRPKELATDNSLAIDTYLYTIKKLSDLEMKNYEEFIVLQPTSPLRTTELIDLAIEQFYISDADSLISVCENSHPLEWSKKIVDNTLIDYFKINSHIKNRQDYKPSYTPNGAIYILKYSILKEARSYYSQKTIPFIMSPEESIDIDTKADFEYASFLLNRREEEFKRIKELNSLIIPSEYSIKEAIKSIDRGGIGMVCISNNRKEIIGIITDGDFRRAIIKGLDIKNNVKEIMNKDFTYVNENYKQKEITEIFQRKPIEHIMVLKDNRLIEIISKNQITKKWSTSVRSNLQSIPVVIMAGGEGTRMQPFTTIFPKPLIPVGNKSLLEVIIEEFSKYSMKEFFISVNYKAKIIKAYMEDKKLLVNMNYVNEKKPLGTAGALKFLQKKIHSTFFVSNCDIIIKADYDKMVEFHNKGRYQLTIIASMRYHKIPYGVCQIENDGDLKEIIEKPEYDFLVNTGMYLLEPNVLEFIPENTFFHITHLINILLKENIKVGVYPISEGSWLDLGQIEEYKNSINKLEAFYQN